MRGMRGHVVMWMPQHKGNLMKLAGCPLVLSFFKTTIILLGSYKAYMYLYGEVAVIRTFILPTLPPSICNSQNSAINSHKHTHVKPSCSTNPFRVSVICTMRGY